MTSLSRVHVRGLPGAEPLCGAQAAASTKARHTDLDEEYPLFRPPVADELTAEVYRAMDPGVNLAADYYDSFSEGYGNLHHAGKARLLRGVWPLSRDGCTDGEDKFAAHTGQPAWLQLA